MKKVLLACLLCIYGMVDAQPFEHFFNKNIIEYHLYVPNEVWGGRKENPCWEAGLTYIDYIYREDTAYFNNVCYYKYYWGPRGSYIGAYLREDTTCGKIYRYYPYLDTEYVWCDMSLNVGDTFFLPTFNDRMYWYEEQGTQLVVDSIAYINGKKIIYFPYIGTSRMWYDEYFFKDQTIVKLSFIEGIGPTYGPSGCTNSRSWPDESLSFLLCVHVNDSLEFIANPNVGCNIDYVPVEEQTSSQYIQIHPNPAKDYIYINLPEKEIKSIKLYNLLGVLLKEQKSNTANMDISSLSAGMYMLSIETGQYLVTKKFVKE